MIWDTVLAFVASIGGGGAIVLGLSSYIGKLWADQLLQKKSQEFEKELESYKKDLSLEIEKYKSKSEKLTYISKVQFDAEYDIYRKIFDALFDFSAASSNLFPYGLDQIPADMEERKKEYIKRYEFYVNSFNAYSRIIEVNAPFIPKHIYSIFAEIRQAANEIACMYPEIRIQADEHFKDDYERMAHENFVKTGEFNKKIPELKDNVRSYLATLKVTGGGTNNDKA